MLFGLVIAIFGLQTAAANFLDVHQDRIFALHEVFNRDLTYLRSDFQNVLASQSDAVSAELVFVVDSLHTQNQLTQDRLNLANNNTCIQNLRNILNNVLSLSGFRIGTCSRSLYNEKIEIGDPIYEQIDRFQVRINNLPIMFMDVLNDQHLLNDEQLVVKSLNERYQQEVGVYNVDYNEFLNVDYTQMLHKLNLLVRDLNVCFVDIVNSFMAAAQTTENEISFICGQ